MTNSRKPLDNWMPTEGAGRSLGCVATSFTFEIDFFEQQCLSRFLGLEWKLGEENDLAFLIEQEEKLRETRVSVLVDRSSATEGRSLSWDLLPVGVRGGLMHAKVCVLVWEELVRGIVGSANLTSAGYRRQLEAQVVIDATPGGEEPREVFDQLFDSVSRLISRAPGAAQERGPKQRARATLDEARRRCDLFSLRSRRRDAPKMAIFLGQPSHSALDRLAEMWSGPRPAKATVLSPYFDAADGPSLAADKLLAELRQRGSQQVDFVVASHQLESTVRIQAPRSISETLPTDVARFRQLRLAEGDGERELHAKALVLESDRHVAALVGSSNFTAAGLGLAATGNLEVNVAFAARRDSTAGRELRSLIPSGDPVDLRSADFEPEEPSDDEPVEAVLPWGFVNAVVKPVPDATLCLTLTQELPGRWRVLDHAGAFLTDRDEWVRRGSEPEMLVALGDGNLPYFLQVEWFDGREDQRATWPVNVTDPAKLPPPEKLRDLPLNALLRALGSTRPLYESLSREIERGRGTTPNDELDPLRRFSSTGQLLHRAKEVSLALEGLRKRLERPAGSEEALLWRVQGPFGPVEIAKGLIARGKAEREVRGETSFLLAEIALTLSRVDWRRTGSLLPGGTRLARRHAREALNDLRDLRDDVTAESPELSDYIESAFAKAQL